MESIKCQMVADYRFVRHKLCIRCECFNFDCEQGRALDTDILRT
mgnify:CR=1 FL=1